MKSVAGIGTLSPVFITPAAVIRHLNAANTPSIETQVLAATTVNLEWTITITGMRHRTPRQITPQNSSP